MIPACALLTLDEAVDVLRDAPVSERRELRGRLLRIVHDRDCRAQAEADYLNYHSLSTQDLMSLVRKLEDSLPRGQHG